MGKKITVAILFTIMALIFMARRQTFLIEKFYEIHLNKSSLKFVILSTTTRPRYRFLLPITVAFWQKLGVKALVILVKDKNDSDTEITDTLNFLKELNAVTEIVYSNKLSAISLSQIIRLFGPAISTFNKQLSNDSILITSDADLAVFNLSNHIPKVSDNKLLHLYSIACCGPINVPPMRGDYEVRMHSISTIGATVKTWREIMEFKKSALSIDEIENYIVAEFGIDFFHPSDEFTKIHGSSVWFADQSLISYKVDKWLKNSNNNDSVSYKTLPFERRIDRSKWPTPEQFAKINIDEYDDCHQPTAPYAPGEWEKYVPFLEKTLKSDNNLTERLTKYKLSFTQI